MKTLFCRRLPLIALALSTMSLGSSCQLLAPIMPLLSSPLSLLGSALGAVAANPLGTAAAAAAL